jgi:hypothetical protein
MANAVMQMVTAAIATIREKVGSISKSESSDPESVRLQYYTSLQFIAQGKRGWPDSDSVILMGLAVWAVPSTKDPPPGLVIFDFINVFCS